MTTRCEWSDLPADQCDHCGAAPGTRPRLSDVAVRPARADVRRAPRRGGLPILGVEDGHQPDIHDMVDELVRAHGHRERYTEHRGNEVWNRQHITEVPALVDQLLGAMPGGSKDQAGSSGGKSRPTARIEAVDTLMLIDDEASRWVRRLGEDDPGDRVDPKTKRHIPGSGTIACIRLLHGLHASAERCGRPKPHRGDGGRPTCCTAHTIEHDVRRWWHQARIITGWDTPAYRPFNTCPVCEQRGALRINLVLRAGFCVECRSVWGPDEIGLLAEHIRSENLEDDDQTTRDTPASA